MLSAVNRTLPSVEDATKYVGLTRVWFTYTAVPKKAAVVEAVHWTFLSVPAKGIVMLGTYSAVVVPVHDADEVAAPSTKYLVGDTTPLQLFVVSFACIRPELSI